MTIRTRAIFLITLASAACARRVPPLTPVEAVTSSLRGVASAQEAHYADHRTYTTDLDVLRMNPGCRIHSGVTITIHSATAEGWAASGFHARSADRSCVQWVSRPGGVAVPVTLRDSLRGDARPGGVVCDTPEEPQR